MQIHGKNTDDAMMDAAVRLGAEHGKAAGSWVIDGNTSEEAARALLAGIEDGDPAVLDLLPSAPLSGEWADGMTPDRLLCEIAGTSAWDGVFTDNEASAIMDEYETAYTSAVEDEVTRAAHAILGA